jgi:ribosomal protein S25
MKCHEFTLPDPPSEGRTLDPELVQKVSEEIKMNFYLSLRILASKLGSNKDTVRKILIEERSLKKCCCKWIPHKLTDSQ